MMKKILGALALALPLAAMANPENYTVDPTHSFAYFEVEHLGVSNQRGRGQEPVTVLGSTRSRVTVNGMAA